MSTNIYLSETFKKKTCFVALHTNGGGGGALICFMGVYFLVILFPHGIIKNAMLNGVYVSLYKQSLCMFSLFSLDFTCNTS